MHVAEYWNSLDDGRIRCILCPNNCELSEGERGICLVRRVVSGHLITDGYGQISSLHIDPIEKKPLARFFPGTSILSAGGWGCNLGCVFCQNWTISQDCRISPNQCPPDLLAAKCRENGSIGIAYTYNEPLINIEYVRDCAVLVHEAGGKNVLVTNGYIHQKPAGDLLPHIDAANIDIKSINPEFYTGYCSGNLTPVLQFSKLALKYGCHVEITNLIIPGLNDSDDEIAELAEWIRMNLGDQTPLHLSAYHPQYKLSTPATPVATIKRAEKICRGKLKYIYLGNVGLEYRS